MRALAQTGFVFRNKGNLSYSKKILNTLIDIFKECGSDGWVERYETEVNAYL